MDEDPAFVGQAISIPEPTWDVSKEYHQLCISAGRETQDASNRVGQVKGVVEHCDDNGSEACHLLCNSAGRGTQEDTIDF